MHMPTATGLTTRTGRRVPNGEIVHGMQATTDGPQQDHTRRQCRSIIIVGSGVHFQKGLIPLGIIDIQQETDIC
jgi:hypothetical protein